MPTSIIAQVINDNERPFESQYGPLYSYTVHFEDGNCFKVNSKSPDTPPWQVGQEWNYEAGKTFNGRTSAKLSKPQFAGQGHPAVPAQSQANPAPAVPIPKPAPQNPVKAAGTPVPAQRNGQRDGLCLKIAADFMIAAKMPLDAVNLAGFAYMVEKAMNTFEHGAAQAHANAPDLNNPPF